MTPQETVNSNMQDFVRDLISSIGEDAERPGLKGTPERVQKSLQYLTQGYSQDPEKVLNGAIFDCEYDEMVLVKDIDFFSLCEHHLLPFFGKCHIAYLPDKKIVGLSKLPRLVDVFSRRLQVQERLTTQVARIVEDTVRPKGVGVVLEAFHLCVMMRGVGKQNAHMVTSSMRGRFRVDPKTREEFLELIKRAKPI